MIDYDLLKKYCDMNEAELIDFVLNKFGGTYDQNGRYLHISRGASTLAVGHIDTVLNPKEYPAYVANGYFFSPSLDDRAGVFAILEVLPKLGVTSDVLLTTDEEKGKSTGWDYAKHVKTDHPYNFVYQFDRSGSDVVMYCYETDELCDLLEGYGFEIGIGSFSDISYMESLQVKGFNFGIGYHNEHSPKCHLSMVEFVGMVNIAAKFITDNQDQMMDHEPESYENQLYGRSFGKNYRSTRLHKSSRHYHGETEYCSFCDDLYYPDEMVQTPGYGEICVYCQSLVTNGRYSSKNDGDNAYEVCAYCDGMYIAKNMIPIGNDEYLCRNCDDKIFEEEIDF